MNSNLGKNFDFDLGLGTSRSKSLNDQKNKTPSYSSYASSSSSYSSTQTRPAWQPNKPSWTHQPAQPNLSNPPSSMVGDIFGKSWCSTANSGSTAAIGIVEKNPNLFGDLVSSSLGSGKSNANAPLKNAAPASVSLGAASNINSFSMRNMADSLPKASSNPGKNSGNWSFDNLSSRNSNQSNTTNIKAPNLGGPSMSSTIGSGKTSSNKDPFGSLVDFGSKSSGNLNSTSKSQKINSSEDLFGDFQNASKPSTTAFPSSGPSGSGVGFKGSSFHSDINLDGFGMPSMDFGSKVQDTVQTSVNDPLDMLFSSSKASAGGAPVASEAAGVPQSLDADDWGLDSEFGGGGHDMGGSTTEIEGLPPPPAGVTASLAKNKGVDVYKQGQYADAIKWLSWAVVLFEKAGDNAAIVEVLSTRASCYKEVGEYKKAVVDCTKVLDQDDANVSVLVQRALLYESMEKYKLGSEDLRAVLKIDPGNRVARSTIHRLTKLAN
ncbi:nuclear pore complex protein NUP62-like [Cucurbita moschata]|uniref:Nuclear pore complex protein NUP62-like n=1 Tax=Cucurbita moschata TaxID=3662 RepID=A0A6J1GV19_CUCMO|nr:nuclear pore complex protein NUP62-like [Cucurbita moschata]